MLSKHNQVSIGVLKNNDIPDVVIHESNRIGKKQRILWIVSTSVVIILCYVFVNIELYRQHRRCRDAWINDITLATVTDITPEFVIYNISNYNTCKITNLGQNTFIGAKYMIYRSNNGDCSLDKEKYDSCSFGLMIFNVVFTMLGAPVLFACTRGIFRF